MKKKLDEAEAQTGYAMNDQIKLENDYEDVVNEISSLCALHNKDAFK